MKADRGKSVGVSKGANVSEWVGSAAGIRYRGASSPPDLLRMLERRVSSAACRLSSVVCCLLPLLLAAVEL